MTVGTGVISGLVGWDVGALFGGDALTDADFEYENETYELYTIGFNSDTGALNVTFDATNSGSIADAAVRGVMTLYVDGRALALGDATYQLTSNGRHALAWDNTGLTWSAGDTVQLEMGVSEYGRRRAGEAAATAGPETQKGPHTWQVRAGRRSCPDNGFAQLQEWTDGGSVLASPCGRPTRCRDSAYTTPERPTASRTTSRSGWCGSSTHPACHGWRSPVVSASILSP